MKNNKKNMLILVLVVAILMSFSACSIPKQETDIPETSDNSSMTITSEESTSIPDTQQESDRSLLQLPARPVAISSNLLIIQNETDQRYGLYSLSGQEILPCEYTDMTFITVNASYNPKVYISAQMQGFYGVYDQNGTEIVAPAYDEIVGGAEYADCIIVKRSDFYGAVDLQGNEILPVQYENIDSSPKGNLVALTEAENATNVEVYSVDGVFQSSFQAEVKGASSIYFNDWGEILTIGDAYEGRRMTLSGEEWNGMLSSLARNGYFSYRHGTALSFIDGRTNEELVSLDLGYEANQIFLSGEWYNDVSNENTICIFYYQPFDGTTALAEPAYYLASLGSATPIISPVESYDVVGPFYRDSAFAVINDTIYTLDASGHATEIPVPFQQVYADARYFLYEGCAVLNNNGYIYVIDKTGNTILSEDGYVDVNWTYDVGEGLIALTASDGTTQLIDTYGNEIVSQGNDYQQVTLYDGKGEDIERYSLIHDITAEQYIFIDNENFRALVSHNDLDEELFSQLNSGTGYVLWDETEQKLFAVICNEEGYLIGDVAGAV